MKNPGKKIVGKNQKGEINCLQAVEGKNKKKHKTKVNKSMAESLHSDQAFFCFRRPGGSFGGLPL